MSDRHSQVGQRMLELLADRALFGLSVAEQAELDRILRRAADFDAQCMDRTAAGFHLACAPEPAVELPHELAERIRRGACRALCLSDRN